MLGHIDVQTISNPAGAALGQHQDVGLVDGRHEREGGRELARQGGADGWGEEESRGTVLSAYAGTPFEAAVQPLAIVDAATAKVLSHFSAGTVNLENIDTKKDGAFKFDGNKENVLREPDTVKWIDNDRLVIALEGTVAGWDYRSALNMGRSKRDTKAGSGWLSVDGIATVQTTWFIRPPFCGGPLPLIYRAGIRDYGTQFGFRSIAWIDWK